LKNLPVVGFFGKPGSIPTLGGFDRPFHRLVGVAVGAGIGATEREPEIRARNPEAVVVPQVHAHVVTREHVAGDATRTGRIPFVVMVLGHRVHVRAVTTEAEQILLFGRLQRVGFVAVGADDARGVHPTLEEGTPDVDLVENLAIRVIEGLVEKCRTVGVEKRLPADRLRVHDAAARMAAPAGIELRIRPLFRCAACELFVAIEAPDAVVAEIDRQSIVGIAEIERALVLDARFRASVCPRHMGRSRAVALLAGDVDFLPASLVAIFFGEVILLQVRRVAIGAHVVPVLIRPGPVKNVTVGNRVVWVEVEPTLAAFALGPIVPAHAQGLKAPARKFDQVLLERIEAEHIRDLVIVEFAVGPIRTHEKLSIAPKKTGGDAEMRELGVIEIAEHGALIHDLHREIVMRSLPQFVLGDVAGLASLAPHEGERSDWRFHPALARLRSITARGQCGDCDDRAKPGNSIQWIPSVNPRVGAQTQQRHYAFCFGYLARCIAQCTCQPRPLGAVDPKTTD
jgi:hypothetical protein